MTVISPKKASKFFRAKMDFTTGPMELDGMLKRGEKIRIIDVRGPEDYAAGHIHGAINLPKERWATFAGLSRDEVNIVYCYSEVCHLAAEASRDFALNDYSVMELEGGFDEWQKHDLPIET